MAKLLDSTTPFKDFADTYTLSFVDGVLKASKADLSTYGNYFSARFNLEMPSKEIDLSEIDKESFEAIRSFVRSEMDLDSIDPESLDELKDLATYFSIEELEKTLCKTVGEAIALANKYELQEIDITKFALTDQDIDQILSSRSLRRIGETIDLKALFPKLNIIDDAVWKAHADMAAYGLDADHAIDLHAAIRNLHEMFRTLKIEGDASITLLKMPKGLTLNKLLAIISKPLQGNPIGCRNILEASVNLFGDSPITESYTVAITDSVLKESRKLSVSAQQELVQKHGCNMPALLEMMALTLMTYVSSSEEPPKRLFGSSYSRVVEKIRSYNLVVGSFSPSGLNVNFSPNCSDLVLIGVAGLRKF